MFGQRVVVHQVSIQAHGQRGGARQGGSSGHVGLGLFALLDKVLRLLSIPRRFTYI